MGAHKGKSWKDKPSVVRYQSKGQRRINKMRRIARCNGEKFLKAWKVKYPA